MGVWSHARFSFNIFWIGAFLKTLNALKKWTDFKILIIRINIPVGPVTYITYFNTWYVLSSMTSIGPFNVLYLCLVFIESKIAGKFKLSILIFYDLVWFFFLSTYLVSKYYWWKLPAYTISHIKQGAPMKISCLIDSTKAFLNFDE